MLYCQTVHFPAQLACQSGFSSVTTCDYLLVRSLYCTVLGLIDFVILESANGLFMISSKKLLAFGGSIPDYEVLFCLFTIYYKLFIRSQ